MFKDSLPIMSIYYSNSSTYSLNLHFESPSSEELKSRKQNPHQHKFQRISFRVYTIRNNWATVGHISTSDWPWLCRDTKQRPFGHHMTDIGSHRVGWAITHMPQSYI